MPNFQLEGTGASIAFAASQFASNLISLDLPEQARAALETTHLGTTIGKSYKPAKLKNVGTISAEFDHNPQAVDLLLGNPELITISYPLLTGQVTPTKIQFQGFALTKGGESFKVDALLTTKVTLQVTGDLTIVAAT